MNLGKDVDLHTYPDYATIAEISDVVGLPASSLVRVSPGRSTKIGGLDRVHPRLPCVGLGAWLAATGDGTITCTGNTALATNKFRGLIPGGLYQVVRLQFTPQGPKRTPLGKLDGSNSTFVAGKDGTATFTNTLPFCPAPSEGVVLAWHSEGTNPGASMGEIGVNVHNQLATRIAPSPTLPRTGGTPLAIALVLGGAFAALGLILRVVGRRCLPATFH